MKKIQRSFTFNEDANTHAVILERVGDALVIRYFSRCGVPDGITPISEAEPLVDVGASEYTPTSGTYYTLGAVGVEGSEDDFCVEEIGRHMISPQISQRMGLSETGDFFALVAPMTLNLKPEPLYNHFAESTTTKSALRRTGQILGKIAQFAVVGASFADGPDAWTLVRAPLPAVSFVDRTSGAWEVADESFSLISALPTISLTSDASITAGGETVVNVSVVPAYSGELVVEPVSGYVPHSRVEVFGGSGSFKVMALAMQPGDTLRVKVGTKLVTGLAEVQINVVL
jgi:hypothetical protein